MLKPIIKKLEESYQNSFHFYQIDFDDNKLSNKLFGINNTPSMLVAYDKSISKIEGAFPYQSYKEYFDKIINQVN